VIEEGHAVVVLHTDFQPAIMQHDVEGEPECNHDDSIPKQELEESANDCGEHGHVGGQPWVSAQEDEGFRPSQHNGHTCPVAVVLQVGVLAVEDDGGADKDDGQLDQVLRRKDISGNVLVSYEKILISFTF